MSKPVQPSAETIKPYLHAWIKAMQAEQPRKVPDDNFFSTLQDRVGGDVLSRIAMGLSDGLVIQKGYRFDVTGSPSRDGFLWFSRRKWRDFGLHPNWEAFVHVNYFLRIWAAQELDMPTITFEDRHLDLALWQDKRLWWNIEVKEKPAVAQRLIQGIMQRGRGAEVSLPGSEKRDAIRKGTRIIAHKPEFFGAVALGYQVHYKVTFQDAAHFTLDESPPPFEF